MGWHLTLSKLKLITLGCISWSIVCYPWAVSVRTLSNFLTTLSPVPGKIPEYMNTYKRAGRKEGWEEGRGKEGKKKGKERKKGKEEGRKEGTRGGRKEGADMESLPL